jgi:transposase
MERLRPFCPKSYGCPRVVDLRLVSGIVLIIRNGLRWCDASRSYGPPKTLCDRLKRWGDTGNFVRMMEGLTSESARRKSVMIDAIHLKAHRKVSSRAAK